MPWPSWKHSRKNEHPAQSINRPKVVLETSIGSRHLTCANAVECCNPTKLLCAIERLRNRCLAPGGQVVASLPIGYNEFFDGLLRDGKSPFTRQHFLKRISKRNYWVESDWEQVRDVPYGRFVTHAIVIGTIQG